MFWNTLQIYMDLWKYIYYDETFYDGAITRKRLLREFITAKLFFESS